MSLKRVSNFDKSSCVKKLRFDDEVKVHENEFTPKFPPNYFHLGGENFVFVSYFANQVRIHLRKYIRHESGYLQPTRMGLTLSPCAWEYLTKEMNILLCDFTSTSSPVLIRDSILVAPVTTSENSFNVSLQRYFLKKDFSRCFLPDICLLTENEWENLKKIRNDVSTCVTTLLLNRLLRYSILKGVKNQAPVSPSALVSPTNILQSDVELTLTTSLTELLQNHFAEQMKNVFTCYGCLVSYENQLGHECLTMNYNDRLIQYEQLALFSIDFEKLALDYVNQNANFVNYITKHFLLKLDMIMLLKNAKDLYIASDPTSVHIC